MLEHETVVRPILDLFFDSSFDDTPQIIKNYLFHAGNLTEGEQKKLRYEIYTPMYGNITEDSHALILYQHAKHRASYLAIISLSPINTTVLENCVFEAKIVAQTRIGIDKLATLYSLIFPKGCKSIARYLANKLTSAKQQFNKSGMTKHFYKIAEYQINNDINLASINEACKTKDTAIKHWLNHTQQVMQIYEGAALLLNEQFTNNAAPYIEYYPFMGGYRSVDIALNTRTIRSI
jgi:predicted DNA-binding protein YlxM (UPF0122 family)